jgi:acetyl-CoA synthetase
VNAQAPFDWTPVPELVERSVLSAFLRRVGEKSYESLCARADADPAWLMEQVFAFCDFRFYRPYDRMLDTSRGQPWAQWCVGGTTNIVLNCIDRHRGTQAWEQPFLVWEGENPDEQRTLSYREFDAEVCRLANALSERGLGRGDVVGLYMPNLPETYVAFFAVLKLGAILMPLFSGFGPQPLAARLKDGGARAVITADGTWRRGSAAPLKAVLDEALAAAPDVQQVLVVRRMGDHLSTPMQPGRDRWWHEQLASQPDRRATAEMEAGAPAILLYTSGTTGKPKGCVWTHVSFLGSMVTRDMHICCDFRGSDRYFFLSDMGWMVGAMCACIPSYFGGSLLVAEGTPDYPDTGRFWRLVQNHRVTYLGVAPTLIRSLMRYGEEEVERYDLSRLRLLGSGGEAWTDAPWQWFFRHVGKGRLPILNIAGGTEVGGCNLVSTVHHPQRPSSFSGRALGVGLAIVDESGRAVPDGSVGELVLRHANIGMTRSLWRDDVRYLESYWNLIPGFWVHGDFVRRDPDGLYYILGRSDDTIKVSGKRTGPTEIENLLTATGTVSEVAAIGVPDPVKGSTIVCVCVPMPGVEAGAALAQRLSQAVVDGMGASYRPAAVVFVDELPRTRNLKVMRRVVRAVYVGGDPGDLSALVNPHTVENLRRHFRDPAAAAATPGASAP